MLVKSEGLKGVFDIRRDDSVNEGVFGGDGRRGDG